MTIDVNWHDDYHFIYIETPQAFDIAEWRVADQQIHDYIVQKEAPVHVVLNMMHTSKHPINPVEILSNTSWLKHPNLGWTVHITNSNLIRMLARMTIHVLTAHYKQVHSYEAAVEFLAGIKQQQATAPTEPTRPAD